MKKGLVPVLALLLALAATGATFASGSEEAAKPAAAPRAGGRLVDRDVEISVMLAESPLVPVNPDMLHFQWMYERTGIKIKFLPVPSADYTQKKNTLLSTNDLPDIIQCTQTDINNFAETGIFVNLSTYRDRLPNFYDKVAKYPEAKFTFVDGNPYGFPVLNRWDLTRASGLTVRADVMKELGIAAPKTYAQYYDMLKAFKAKYPASIPYINRNGASNLMNTIGYGLGSHSSILFDPQAKRYLFQPAKPETKTVLAYLNSMYKEKLLDPDYVSVKQQQWVEKMANGTGLSFLDNVTFPATNLPALRSKVPTAEWTVLFNPTNSFGYARGLYISPHQLNKIYAMSSKSKNIDAMVKMFNWLYTEEACDLMNLGKEGVDFVRDANGQVSVTPETRKKYSDAQGNFVQTNMHKERGNAAYESFIVYSDLHSYFQATPDFQMKWYTEIQQKDPSYTFPVPTPPFSAKEREQVATIQTALNTVATEMFDKLIMGTEPSDAFDKYLERFKSQGLAELEKIFNDAYARVK